ncbi:hypothetical protein Plhal304r1_c087g0169671 [Plasmopara halstedii]
MPRIAYLNLYKEVRHLDNVVALHESCKGILTTVLLIHDSCRRILEPGTRPNTFRGKNARCTARLFCLPKRLKMAARQIMYQGSHTKVDPPASGSSRGKCSSSKRTPTKTLLEPEHGSQILNFVFGRSGLPDSLL